MCVHTYVHMYVHIYVHRFRSKNLPTTHYQRLATPVVFYTQVHKKEIELFHTHVCFTEQLQSPGRLGGVQAYTMGICTQHRNIQFICKS